MSAEFDRLKAAIRDVVRASLPAVDYLAMYRARVMSQSNGLDLIDVKPDDARIPSMAGVPLVWPAGIVAEIHIPKAVDPPTFVLIGWSGGDPAAPYAIPFAGLGVATKVVIDGDQVFAGGELGAEPPIKGQSFANAHATLLTALVTYAAAIAAIADPSGAATTALGNAITKFVTATPSTFATKAQVA